MNNACITRDSKIRRLTREMFDAVIVTNLGSCFMISKAVWDGMMTSFFGRIFSRSPEAEQPLKYRINLKTEGQATTVSVLNAAGAPETSANAQRIVPVIADDLK